MNRAETEQDEYRAYVAEIVAGAPPRRAIDDPVVLERIARVFRLALARANACPRSTEQARTPGTQSTCGECAS